MKRRIPKAVICKTPLMFLEGLPFYYHPASLPEPDNVFLWVATDGTYGIDVTCIGLMARAAEVMLSELYVYQIPHNLTAAAVTSLLTDDVVKGFLLRIVQGRVRDNYESSLNDDGNSAALALREHLAKRFTAADLRVPAQAQTLMKRFYREQLSSDTPAVVESLGFYFPDRSVDIMSSSAVAECQAAADAQGFYAVDIEEYIDICRQNFGAVRH